MNQSEKFFLRHLSQTTPFPFLIEVKNARGVYIYDVNDKEYMDMIAGVAVNSIGHCHPKVTAALKNQIDKYLHVMVYGEFIQAPQNELIEKLIIKMIIICIIINRHEIKVI